jgi:hypothetical protein
LPPAQLIPALPASAAPQPLVALQKVGFVCGSMQLPLQFNWVPGQETEQTPARHTSPAAHDVPTLVLVPLQPPRAPQWARLVLGSVQTPAQLSRPG